MSRSFAELPDEVKLNIFSFCTKSELCKTISFVCKDWWILSKDPSLWKQVILDFTSDNEMEEIEDIEEIEERVQRLAVGLKRCTMLKQLTIRAPVIGPAREVPSNLFLKIGLIRSLKILSFHSIVLKENLLMQIKENCPFIQKLSFASCPINFSTSNFATICATLVHLKEFILADTKRQDFGDACLEILSRCCRNLERLDISWAKITGKGIMVLAMNCNKTLQRVRLRCPCRNTLNHDFVHFGSCQNLVFLELQGYFIINKASLKALSELPLLESFLLEGLWNVDMMYTLEQIDLMEKGFEMFFGNPCRAKLKYVEFKALSIGESALINISQTCSALQWLRIYHCSGITEHGVREILEKCSALENVCILYCSPLPDNYEARKVNNVLSVSNT